MHEYDTALKRFLTTGRETLRALTSVPIERWHNVELPEVTNRRVDLLGEGPAGELVHIELQSTHDPAMALRMMEYCAAVCRRFGRFPEQIVLYVGEAPLRMTGRLSGPRLAFECRVVDVRELDAERLLASDKIGDNVIAILSRLPDRRAAIRRVLDRIAAAGAGEREDALTGFLVLAGLRRIGLTIEEEAGQMPLLDDIMDNQVLGRERRRGIEIGLSQGRNEGRHEGRHEGELTVLLRMTEKRFGPISPSVRDRLNRMSASELEAAALRLLDARSPEDILG